MITLSRLSFRVFDAEARVDVAGFVSPHDAEEWAAAENARVGRPVYEVRDIS